MGLTQLARCVAQQASEEDACGASDSSSARAKTPKLRRARLLVRGRGHSVQRVRDAHDLPLVAAQHVVWQQLHALRPAGRQAAAAATASVTDEQQLKER
jgi:hypothetical protein